MTQPHRKWGKSTPLLVGNKEESAKCMVREVLETLECNGSLRANGCLWRYHVRLETETPDYHNLSLEEVGKVKDIESVPGVLTKFVEDNFEGILIERKMAKLTLEIETVKAEKNHEKDLDLILLIGLWSVGLLVIMLLLYRASFLNTPWGL